MAVYTDVTEPELTAFLAPYDLGALLSYKGIAEGVENSNFLVRTETGTFILTLYEKRVDKNDLPFFIGLMEHLAARGLSCPLPVETKTGERLGELAGRPAAVFTFLEGMWTRRPNAGRAAASGRRRRRGFWNDACKLEAAAGAGHGDGLGSARGAARLGRGA